MYLCRWTYVPLKWTKHDDWETRVFFGFFLCFSGSSYRSSFCHRRILDEVKLIILSLISTGELIILASCHSSLFGLLCWLTWFTRGPSYNVFSWVFSSSVTSVGWIKSQINEYKPFTKRKSEHSKMVFPSQPWLLCNAAIFLGLNFSQTASADVSLRKLLMVKGQAKFLEK